MTRSPAIRLSLAAALLCPLLSGCVAAVAVPVLAGGTIARKAIKPSRTDRKTKSATVASIPSATLPAPDPAPNTAPAALPLPRDPADVHPGAVYAGNLPPPTGFAAPATAAAPRDPSTASTSGPTPSHGDTGWSAIVRHVAGQMVERPENSVLLARGGGDAAPQWLPCGTKPVAVVANVATVAPPRADGSRTVAPANRQWLGAMRPMDARLILVGAEAEDQRGSIVRALDVIGITLADDQLMLGRGAAAMPALRAEVGARYCVLAIAGTSGPDFPNGLLPAITGPALAPAWDHGWFLFP